MKNAIQFGAGNIGRGFIGAVLRKSSYNVLFCDVNREIIDKINPKEEIIVYCSSGQRSKKAKDKLERLGYEKVYNLYNGWQY